MGDFLRVLNIAGIATESTKTISKIKSTIDFIGKYEEDDSKLDMLKILRIRGFYTELNKILDEFLKGEEIK